MVTLRISTGSYGASLLALLSHLGCGGEVEGGGSTNQGGKSSSTSGGAGTSVGSLGGGGAIGIGGNAGGQAAITVCTPISELNGFVACDGGWTHRAEAQDCTSLLPRTTSCSVTTIAGSCTTDADCTARPYGHCEVGDMSGCYCAYGCVRDADCAAGQLCRCGEPVGQCTTASCATDSSCPGGYCATYDSTAGCGGLAFACTHADDACVGGAQCAGGYCTLGPAGTRLCSLPNCVIGRPFLVQGEDRRARPERRADWLDVADDPELRQLSSEQRERLGNHYVELALMEHAAIAAFARLLLELVGRGAPAELVELVIAAEADEMRHARSMFGLASQLLGRAIGPSELSLSGLTMGSSVQALAYSTVVEGCVGETIAALEAAEAKERARTKPLRQLFAGIAKDEWMHANLSWRVVAWLVKNGDAELRSVVAQAFVDAQASSEPACANRASDEAYGALTSETRRELRQAAWQSVIAPCSARLLDPIRRSATARSVSAPVA